MPQVSAEGIQSTPLNLALSWRGDATNTDLRIDYKYNTDAMAAPVPLHDIQFQVPVDGGEATVQAMVPPATWYAAPTTKLTLTFVKKTKQKIKRNTSCRLDFFVLNIYFFCSPEKLKQDFKSEKKNKFLPPRHCLISKKLV